MMQAMIFAAGLGTRLKPLTDTMPKALVRVGGEPLLKHVIMNLRNEGFTRIVVNVHHFASQIVDYLNANANFGLDIAISDETGMLLDTGGGLRRARHLFSPSEPILIHNVDILSDTPLRTLYASGHGHDATLLVSRRQTSRYLILDDDMRLWGWTNILTREIRSPHKELISLSGREIAHDFLSPETHTPLHLYAFSGIHTFSPSLFPIMDTWPERFPIIDFYLSACATHDIRGTLSADLHLLDVGKLDTLASADAFVSSL